MGPSPAPPAAAEPPPPPADQGPPPSAELFADHDQLTGKLSGGDNIKVIVRIDWAALARGHTTAGDTCDVVGVGPISVDTAKYLMQDAFLAAVITKGVDVVNVAHLGRGLNAHQRTAVELMGIRCSNEKCNRTVAIQIDHRIPYNDKEETKLDNQDPLCPDCHRKKTHHRAYLVPGKGRRAFIEPETNRPDPNPPQPEQPDPPPTTVAQPSLL